MPITASPPWDAHVRPPFPVRRFTVDEFHHMISAGVLTENDRVELLEGWIVPRMVHNPPHDATVEMVQEALRPLVPEGWRIRIQSAITTGDSEPEPDLAIVQGSVRDHVARHPSPQEVALIVEVSDSTLEDDRKIKARLYARAGIAVYWIVNLIDRLVEVCEDPTGPVSDAVYRRQRRYVQDDVVPVMVAGHEVGQVAARELLP